MGGRRGRRRRRFSVGGGGELEGEVQRGKALAPGRERMGRGLRRGEREGAVRARSWWGQGWDGVVGLGPGGVGEWGERVSGVVLGQEVDLESGPGWLGGKS